MRIHADCCATCCGARPVGYETAPAAVWRAAPKRSTRRCSTDVVGTPSGWRACVPRRGAEAVGGRGTLIVMGHIDEIGLIVTHIDDEGYLWFREVGGWDAQILVGQRVVLAHARRARSRA